MLPSRAVEDVALPGDWPDVRDLAREELESYLTDASDGAILGLPTRCPPWTVDDLTRHLAATARRFNEMLGQSRNGDLSPPFAPNELSNENLRAVREFGDDDPLETLRHEAEHFLDAATDPNEVMSHQLGPITVGLQEHFLLTDIAIHHDDLAAATGGSYRPSDAAVEAIARAFAARGWFDTSEMADMWARIIAASGR
jgi:uncharacterized protein (TIGR03083 family)